MSLLPLSRLDDDEFTILNDDSEVEGLRVRKRKKLKTHRLPRYFNFTVFSSSISVRMLTAVFSRNPQVEATSLQAPMATNQNAPLTGNESSSSRLTLDLPSQQSIPPNTYVYTPETQLRDATPKTRFKEEVTEHVIMDYDDFEYNIPETVHNLVNDILQTSSVTFPIVSF